MLIIGSHVHYGKDQLLGSVEEAIKYGANTFMFYTGAPQNTTRVPLDERLIKEAWDLMEKSGINRENVVCHAPYIINLANNKDVDKYKFGIEFLVSEIKRCEHLGIKRLVLHPGSAVGIDRTQALKNISYALNIALEHDNSVIVALETMAGKGSELGITTDELKVIIDSIEKKELTGVCMDTCHLNDSGVDISKFKEYMQEFDEKIGLDKVKVLHINDSKNGIGSHKDRHELLGYGTIGFENILNVVYDSVFENIPKILETPYIGENDGDKDRIYPPYKFEIEELKEKKFNPNLKEDIRSHYKS